MRRTLIGIAVATALVAPSATALARLRTIEFTGNVVLPDEVYLSVLDLAGSDWRTRASNSAAARLVEEQILAFLKTSGYELATVRAEPQEDERILVAIEEGRLDKIIFVGVGTGSTIRLKLTLKLPGDVFNRPLLDRMLKELVETTDVTRASYSVVPVEKVEHRGIQIRDPGLIQGLTLLEPGRPHELRIYLTHDPTASGLSFGLGLAPPTGFYGTSGYRDRSTLLEEDELQVQLKAGVRLTGSEDGTGTRLVISEVSGESRWYTPPFLSNVVRSYLGLEAAILNRNRPDLDVPSYYFAPLRGSLHLELKIWRGLAFMVGGGLEQRFLVSVDEGPMVSPVVADAPRSDRRLFADAGLSWVFNVGELRHDRAHLFEAFVRSYAPTSSTQRTEHMRARYQRVLTFGWDELWLGVSGAYLHGNVPFYEELSITEGFLRVAFADEIHVKKVTALKTEYRISLSRDVLKASVFNNAAIFDELDASRRSVGIRVADDAGLGIHILILDAFQLNTYVGVGLASGERLDLGLRAELIKVF